MVVAANPTADIRAKFALDSIGEARQTWLERSNTFRYAHAHVGIRLIKILCKVTLN